MADFYPRIGECAYIINVLNPVNQSVQEWRKGTQEAAVFLEFSSGRHSNDMSVEDVV